MSDSKHNTSGKDRTKGMWIAIAAGRERNKNRELRWTAGTACIPPVTDVGSAAYRRMLASRVRGSRGRV